MIYWTKCLKTEKNKCKPFSWKKNKWLWLTLQRKYANCNVPMCDDYRVLFHSITLNYHTFHGEKQQLLIPILTFLNFLFINLCHSPRQVLHAYFFSFYSGVCEENEGTTLLYNDNLSWYFHELSSKSQFIVGNRYSACWISAQYKRNMRCIAKFAIYKKWVKW